MRILFVTPYYYPQLRFGGPPQKIHSVARGLIGAGHEVCVATFDHANRNSKDAKEIDGVQVQYLPWRGRGLRQLPGRQDILRSKIDTAELVHCYGLYTAIVPMTARIARRAAIPVVQEPLGMYPPRARNQFMKSIYNAVITQRMLNQAAATIAASEAEAADLESFVPGAEVLCRRNGIDLDAFATLPSPEALRVQWQIAADERVVLFVGRLSPIKNLEQLVSAFARSAVPSSRLILVGPSEPDYEKRLRALVARERLGGRVIFAGPLYGDEQKAALALADLFVLPSVSESFGNAAGEAVAAGVPVLLTETCGIAPLIHGRAGMAVPLGVDSLADGLRRMLNPGVSRNATREGEAGHSNQMTARREEVKLELSWDAPIRQTEELYEKIIRNKKRSARDKAAG